MSWSLATNHPPVGLASLFDEYLAGSAGSRYVCHALHSHAGNTIACSPAAPSQHKAVSLPTHHHLPPRPPYLLRIRVRSSWPRLRLLSPSFSGSSTPSCLQVSTTLIAHDLELTRNGGLLGMNVAAGPELAAAVTNAGGLGVIGGVGYTPKILRQQVRPTLRTSSPEAKRLMRARRSRPSRTTLWTRTGLSVSTCSSLRLAAARARPT